MSMTKDEVLEIIRNISTLGSNPALGGGGVGAGKVCELLDCFVDLIDGEGDTEAELVEFAREVKDLLDSHGQGRRGQWQRIRDKAKKIRAIVHEIRERIKAARERADKLEVERSNEAAARRAAETQKAAEAADASTASAQ